jgi:peptidoglycan/LPS O-acetylase OafA/YrhL
LPGLTGLRALLALWVAVFHLGEHAALHAPAWCRNFLSSGFVAVDCFFVLSGFVLAHAYTGRETRWLPFLRSRLERLAPAYWMALLLVLPFGLVRGESLGALLASFFFLQSWVPDYALQWNPPGWSLSVEMFLYACFPYLRGVTSSWRRMVLLWVLALLPAMLLEWSDASRTIWPWTFEEGSFWGNQVAFAPLYRLAAFVSGIMLYRLRREGTQTALVAFIVAAMCLLSWRGPLPYALVHGGLFLPAAWALVWLGAGLRSGCLCSAPMLLAGECSFAFYLLHRPVWSWLQALGCDRESAAAVALALLLSGVLSWLLHARIETSIRAWWQRTAKTTALKQTG